MKFFQKNKVLSAASARKQNFTYGQDPELELCIVDGATLWMSPNPDPAVSKYMWIYNLTPAKLTYTGTGTFPIVVTRAASAEITAVSISELGNVNSYYSYGIPVADVPAGFAPVRIPDDTPVVCWKGLRSNNHGKNIYLIINTQAITGSCP